MHVVILGDQVSSRVAARRDLELKALRHRLQAINAHVAKHLVVPFSASAGDEIQALVATPDAAWAVIEQLDVESWLQSFRFTIGVGSLTTELAPRTWDMDGPCFHRARDAMDQAKHEKRWVTIRGLGKRNDATVNGVIRALQVIRDHWTERQRSAYSHRRRAELQTDAARTMGLDQSTLSKMLKAARYKEYLEVENTLKDLLVRFSTEGESG